MLRKKLTRPSLEPPKGFEVASWWPPHSHLPATELCCRLLPGELCVFVYTEYHRHLPGALPAESPARGKQQESQRQKRPGLHSNTRPIFEGKL